MSSPQGGAEGEYLPLSTLSDDERKAVLNRLALAESLAQQDMSDWWKSFLGETE